MTGAGVITFKYLPLRATVDGEHTVELQSQLSPERKKIACEKLKTGQSLLSAANCSSAERSVLDTMLRLVAVVIYCVTGSETRKMGFAAASIATGKLRMESVNIGK